MSLKSEKLFVDGRTLRTYGRADGHLKHTLLGKLGGVDLKIAIISLELVSCAPPYLSDYCVPAASADIRRHLRSAHRQLLAVPRYRMNTYGRRAFSVAGPKVWNTLPDLIRHLTISADCFRRLLKTS